MIKRLTPFARRRENIKFSGGFFIRNSPIVFVLLFLLMTAVTLYINVQTRYEDFLQAQKQLGVHAVNVSSEEIQRYIRYQRHLVELYAQVEKNKIADLAHHIDDVTMQRAIFDSLQLYMPQSHNYTIADQQGVPLLPDTGKKVGKGCRKDIVAFAHGIKNNTIFVHSNPEPEGYHFDVMSNVDDGEVFKGVFFVSIDTTVLSGFLEKFQVPGHHLILSRPKNGKTLIELTSEGPRPKLKRPLTLAEDEIAQALFHSRIAGTYWTLYDIPAEGFLKKQYNAYLQQAILIWSVFLAVCLFMLRQIVRETTQRQQAEDRLRETNETLQQQVEVRTRALKQSEQGFREVFDNSRDALYKFSTDKQCFEYISPAIRDISGTDETVFLQGGASFFIDRIHPQDRSLVESQFLPASDTDVMKHIEYRLCHTDGQYRWLSDSRSVVCD